MSITSCATSASLRPRSIASLRRGVIGRVLVEVAGFHQHALGAVDGDPFGELAGRVVTLGAHVLERLELGDGDLDQRVEACR